jgi:hypothetical protein
MQDTVGKEMFESLRVNKLQDDINRAAKDLAKLLKANRVKTRVCVYKQTYA